MKNILKISKSILLIFSFTASLLNLAIAETSVKDNLELKRPNIKTDYYQSFVRQEKDYINFNFNLFNSKSSDSVDEEYRLIFVISKKEDNQLRLVDEFLATTTNLKFATNTINYNYFFKSILSEGEYFASLKVFDANDKVIFNFLPIKDFTIRDSTKTESQLNNESVLDKSLSLDIFKNSKMLFFITIFLIFILSLVLFFIYKKKKSLIDKNLTIKIMSMSFILISSVYCFNRVYAFEGWTPSFGSPWAYGIGNTLTMGQGQTSTVTSPNCPSEISTAIDYGPNLYFNTTNCYPSDARETFLQDEVYDMVQGASRMISNTASLSLSELFINPKLPCIFLSICFDIFNTGEFRSTNKKIVSSPVGFGGGDLGFFLSANPRGITYIHKHTIINTFKTCIVGGPIVPATQVCPATYKSCLDGSIVLVSETCPTIQPVIIPPPLVNIRFESFESTESVPYSSENN